MIRTNEDAAQPANNNNNSSAAGLQQSLSKGESVDGTAKSKKQHKRTIEDGPTTRQKMIIAIIWLTSAFFGVMTCFPDKVFGVEISRKIIEEQLKEVQGGFPLSEESEPFTDGSTLTARGMDLTYCTVKTGLNDLLDYIALIVALVLPLILGPCLVGLCQVRTDIATNASLGQVRLACDLSNLERSNLRNQR